MAVVEPFVTQGQCPLPECEVTLKFDNEQSYLYVCKHPLVRLGDYFKALLLGNFKERDQSEIEINDVSRSDMLLFLRFAVPVENYTAPRPSDITELCTLIALADRFLYPQLCKVIVAHIPEWSSSWSPTVAQLCQLISLGERLLCQDLDRSIAEHILCTPEIYGQSCEAKLDLVQTAYKHQGGSTVILEACVKLCANMDRNDIEKLEGQGLDGVMLAVCSIIVKATPKMSDAPKHSNRQCHFAAKKFDCLAMTDDRRWWWRCSKCSSRQEATLPFEQIKQLEVKISLASVDKAVQSDKSLTVDKSVQIDKSVTVDTAVQSDMSLTLHNSKTMALGNSSDGDLSLQPINNKIHDDVIDDVIRKSRATPCATAAPKKAIQVKRRRSQRQRIATWKLKHAAGAKTTPAKKVPAASKVTVSSIETLPTELAQGQGTPKALTEAQEQAIIKQNENFLLRQAMPMFGGQPSLLKASVQHKHTTNPNAINEQLEAFKRKWVQGPSRGCLEQNYDIEQIYELCRVKGMNSHDTARIKRALAKFLQIQKKTLDTRLNKHRKRREHKAAADSDVSIQSLNLSVIEKAAIDAPSAPVVNDAPPTMTPNTKSVSKCANYFKYLIRFVQKRKLGAWVLELVQSIINGSITPEAFVTCLQSGLDYTGPSYLLPFLQETISPFRTAMANGEVSIDGVDPPGVSDKV